MPEARVQLSLTSNVAPQIAATANSYKTLSSEAQKAELAGTRYAAALTRVALADAKTATEEQRLAVQTANAARAEDQAALSALRLATAQSKVASGSSFGAQTADAFKSSILGIIGPAALAAGALGLIVSTANSFKEAFAFKAQLDQTTASIGVQLSGVRDIGQTFQQASAFAERYKLTQADTTAAIQASIPILRQSNASLVDVESTLLRLQAKKPEKSIADAARALDELKSGQIVSIVDQFNVSRDSANAMKNEIAGGADAVTVLSKYLTDAGIGMNVLELRTQGAAGAINDAAVASERLKLAQGKFAEGPGAAFTDFGTNILKEVTALLSGDFTEINARNKERIIGEQAYNAALRDGKTDAQAYAAAQDAMRQSALNAAQATASLAGAYNANVAAIRGNIGASGIYRDVLSTETQKKLDSAQAAAQLTQEQSQLDRDSRLAAQGMLGAGDQALILAQKYGIAANQAQFLIDQQQKLSNATALADQRVGERDPNNTNTAAENTKFAKLAQQGAQQAAADAKRLADSNDQLALARATTKAQKIAILNRELARATNQIERNSILAQIEGEQNSGAGRVTAAESTALKLSDIARSSGDDRVRIERENQEKLRDAQQDFDVRSARSEEDYQEKRRKLLAGGQRAQAAALAADHAKEQKRAQEDFDRERQRTIRNNQEALGDQGTRVGNQVESIGARTAARGGTVQGLPSAGRSTSASLPNLPSAAGAASAPIRVTVQAVWQINGKAFATSIWPDLEPIVDTELANALAQGGVPNAGQRAVGGAG